MEMYVKRSSQVALPVSTKVAVLLKHHTEGALCTDSQVGEGVVPPQAHFCLLWLRAMDEQSSEVAEI
jgi:hypothetical protein